MSTTPSANDLRAAALWLDHNEGDARERAPMERVARWLEQQADAKDLRGLAKENGVPVGSVRRAMARAN